jgi:hypothetical protein
MASNSTIPDIDEPLYKHGLIYKHDINNYFYDNKRKKKQRMKTLALTLWILFNIFRYSFYLIYNKNGRVPLYYFDFAQDIGGIAVLYYGGAIFFSIFGLRIIYLFNFSDSSHYGWLEIIKHIKGLRVSNSNIHLNSFQDLYQMRKFIDKVRILKELMTKGTLFLAFCFVPMSATVMLMHYSLIDSIKYGIFATLLICFWIYYNTSIVFESVLYYYIICVFSKMNLKLLNESILMVCKQDFLQFLTIDGILKQHNECCNTIEKCNLFWKRYYFALIYTITPTNVIVLHQLLFESVYPATRLSLFGFLFISLLSYITLNSITASVHKETKISFKAFQKLYLRMNSSFNPRRKLKV